MASGPNLAPWRLLVRNPSRILPLLSISSGTFSWFPFAVSDNELDEATIEQGDEHRRQINGAPQASMMCVENPKSFRHTLCQEKYGIHCIYISKCCLLGMMS